MSTEQRAERRYGAIVVGGGQAGLSASYWLSRAGVDHVVFEKNSIMHKWREERWDSFCLVTPNWQCQLPGHAYEGPDPHGFMVKHEILGYLDGFARKTNGSVREGVEVLAVEREKGLFHVTTTAGRFLADAVFLATSLYGDPYRPRCAERVPNSVAQIHSTQYRNAAALPPGAVIVVGSGQAGLSASYWLSRAGVDHVVFEKKSIMHKWREERWDTFCLVTPNWQCQLPGYAYAGSDPHGFMVKHEILAYLDGFVRKTNGSVREGVEVLAVKREKDLFHVTTSAGRFLADAVFLATSLYGDPYRPRCAERVPDSVAQIHSAEYRNSAALPPGVVIVVGAGQSGAQIAEDLHLDGRKVHLVTGNAPRCARFYRGRDVVDWLTDIGQYEITVADEGMGRKRQDTNHRTRRRTRHRSAGVCATGHVALWAPQRRARRPDGFRAESQGQSRRGGSGLQRYQRADRSAHRQQGNRRASGLRLRASLDAPRGA